MDADIDLEIIFEESIRAFSAVQDKYDYKNISNALLGYMAPLMDEKVSREELIDYLCVSTPNVLESAGLSDQCIDAIEKMANDWYFSWGHTYRDEMENGD